MLDWLRGFKKKSAAQRGKIFFFSGPSGVGKGTLINHLRETQPTWVFPPSCTTRAPRPGEVDGETYFFITPEEFEAKIAVGDFLEYAHVHGETYYGTLREKILDPVRHGKTVIREFDVQGFTQARERLNREDFVSIFLRPAEDLDTLVRRIKERAPIAEEELSKRVASMQKELALADIYDYQIFSEDGNLEKLFKDAEAIISQEQAPVK
jgi:guanylate kinase